MVEEALAGDGESWEERFLAGLTAALALLAAEPELARQLFVGGSAPGGSFRFEYERALTRLAKALQGVLGDRSDSGQVPLEQARLLAGGLVSHVSGRVLAGEAERLPEDRDLLLRYLLAFSPRYTF